MLNCVMQVRKTVPNSLSVLLIYLESNDSYINIISTADNG